MKTLRETWFPNLKTPVYLNHAALSPAPLPVQKAIESMATEWACGGVSAWTRGLEARARGKRRLAGLMHCSPSELAFTQNTTHGLQAVAYEFPWRKGDSLVLFNGEFPANVRPWLNAAERFQLHVHWLSIDDLLDETPALQKVLDQKPRLLAVSWVQFMTGATVSLQKLSALRQDRGLAVCIDAIQGLGALQLNLQETPLDFVAGGCHKWLMSPEGTGYLYVAKDIRESMRPLFNGWLSSQDAVDFLLNGPGLMNYHQPCQHSPLHLEWATMNHLGLVGFDAALGMIEEIGPQVIQSNVVELADYARLRLSQMGAPVYQKNARAGLVAIDTRGRMPGKWISAFSKRGIIVAYPNGYLRIAPHFYNTKADIDAFCEAFAEIDREADA